MIQIIVNAFIEKDKTGESSKFCMLVSTTKK